MLRKESKLSFALCWRPVLDSLSSALKLPAPLAVLSQMPDTASPALQYFGPSEPKAYWRKEKVN